MDVNKIDKPRNLREALSSVLSKKDLSFLRTSYDIIGSIAILEIPPELRKKQKIIGGAVLGIHPNVHTVLKKASAHSGKFRTQKLSYLAGVKTKVSMHKENNCRLLLDVEKIYFSPRMGTERLRIASQIKPEEEVLVMFSGCAPYPCVCSKNSLPKSIVAIEANPVGHSYACENIKLNKITNVKLYCSDVRKIMPLKNVGLKSWWHPSQIRSRLKKKPRIIELYLKDGDLEKNRKGVVKAINSLSGLDVYIHQPFKFHNKYIGLNLKDPSSVNRARECYRILEDLCIKFPQVKGYICHPDFTFAGKPDASSTFRNASSFGLIHAYFENPPDGSFTKLNDLVKLARGVGSNKICVDLVHLFMTLKSTDKMVKSINSIPPDIDVYFHVADSSGIHDCLPIGSGKINFSKITPLIKKGVLEIVHKDELKPFGALNSYNLSLFNSSFDRILMPLPKGGEDFLDLALSNSKKGTIINFYDFMHEDFFDKSIDKVAVACSKAHKKCRILRVVKCGQHAPRVFRVCVDFQII